MKPSAAQGPELSGGDLVEAALLGAIGYVCFSFYEVVGRAAGLRGLDLGAALRTPLDDAMPFLPVFVVPYALAYVAPILAAVVVARKGGMAALRRAFFAYLGLLLVHFAFYLAAPSSASGIMLPDSALGPGFLEACVRFFYRIAPPWNAFPSFHVAGGWFFYRALALRDRGWARGYALWFWPMFVSVSAIKIHWALDAVSGWLLAEAWYRWVLLSLERRGACAWTWGSERARAAAHLAPLTLLAAGLWGSLSALGAWR